MFFHFSFINVFVVAFNDDVKVDFDSDNPVFVVVVVAVDIIKCIYYY